MFVGLVPLVAVVLGRLISVRGRRAPVLTIGLCAIAVAFVVRLNIVDEAIDPRVSTVANVTDLWHVLLAGAAWWTLGKICLPVIFQDRRVRERIQRALDTHRQARTAVRFVSASRSVEVAAANLWAAVNLAMGTAAWLVWLLGDVSRVEVDDMMDLHDPGSEALTWLYLAWPFVGGVIVFTAALVSLRDPESPRLTTAGLLGIGIVGIGISVTGAAFLLTDSDALEAYFPTVMLVWGVPGLLLLAGVGLVTAAGRREDVD
ncbi:MAG: hypothetical protein JWN03_1150 [Nocardia sp.]|uniref:hypothetical protein n=1 Tax=Nocardia sp. TaxID=1821 RepID=UPI002610C3DB|nr:hypothetical protein [Nocardia sp.]MCU1640875.1 hypothetical protein [Nocardia sp.]